MPYRLQIIAPALLATITCAAAQRATPVMPASTMTFRAFPEAETVRRIRRDVDQVARAAIEDRLPFQVHFEELGEHNLYVAFRGKKPVGLLYTRSEETDWGLTDIGWSMSLEGKIVGFEFANIRSKRAVQLTESAFAKSLIGCDFTALKRLHAALPAPAGETAQGEEELSRIVLRSALKATIIAAVVWQDEIDKLADLAMLIEEFPGATDRRRSVATIARGEADDRAVLALRYMEGNGRSGFSLGSVARTEVRYGRSSIGLRWVLDAERAIIRIKPVTSWPDAELRHACNALRGHRLDEAELPATPLTAAARELSQEIAKLTRSRRGR